MGTNPPKQFGVWGGPYTDPKGPHLNQTSPASLVPLSSSKGEPLLEERVQGLPWKELPLVLSLGRALPGPGNAWEGLNGWQLFNPYLLLPVSRGD